MSKPLHPNHAPVRPRVIPRGSRLPVLLEEAVRQLLERGARGFVALIGKPGSGKSTALSDLAKRIEPDRLVLIDDASPDELTAHWFDGSQLVVYSAESVHTELGSDQVVFVTEPWTDDDILEYALATDSESCAHVMSRVLNDEVRGMMRGNPELWRPVLDQLAGDRSLDSVVDALHKVAVAEGRVEIAAKSGAILESRA